MPFVWAGQSPVLPVVPAWAQPLAEVAPYSPRQSSVAGQPARTAAVLARCRIPPWRPGKLSQLPKPRDATSIASRAATIPPAGHPATPTPDRELRDRSIDRAALVPWRAHRRDPDPPERPRTAPVPQRESACRWRIRPAVFSRRRDSSLLLPISAHQLQ